MLLKSLHSRAGTPCQQQRDGIMTHFEEFVNACLSGQAFSEAFSMYRPADSTIVGAHLQRSPRL
jgi:hypothetical protein